MFSGLLAEHRRDRELIRRRLHIGTMEHLFAAPDLVTVDDDSKLTVHGK